MKKIMLISALLSASILAFSMEKTADGSTDTRRIENLEQIDQKEISFEAKQEDFSLENKEISFENEKKEIMLREQENEKFFYEHCCYQTLPLEIKLHILSFIIQTSLQPKNKLREKLIGILTELRNTLFLVPPNSGKAAIDPEISERQKLFREILNLFKLISNIRLVNSEWNCLVENHDKLAHESFKKFLTEKNKLYFECQFLKILQKRKCMSFSQELSREDIKTIRSILILLSWDTKTLKALINRLIETAREITIDLFFSQILPVNFNKKTTSNIYSTLLIEILKSKKMLLAKRVLEDIAKFNKETQLAIFNVKTDDK